MQKNSKYVAMSLRGQFVTLARMWLLENGPVTKEEYVEAVRPLMPSHIRGKNQKKISKLSLTNRALTCVGVCNADGKWTAKPYKKLKTESTSDSNINKVRRLIESKQFVSVEDVRHITNGDAKLRILLQRGEVVRVEKGVYSKKD